jgi:Fe-S cluster assembly ATP-binding protein
VSETPLLAIEDLHARPADDDLHPSDILQGVELAVGAGEVHAVMGPNGSGKSTLAFAVMGNPEYRVTAGRILYQGDDVTDWPTEVRAKAGMFLGHQYPQSLPGVSVVQFLRQARSARTGVDLSVLELRLSIMEWMDLNDGFSGGEKKRNEILQMAVLEPDLAVLDETDSGLDVDALKVVARGVEEVRRDRPQMGVVLITHYQRLLRLLVPDRVHVLVRGRIVRSGGPELADELEREGYDAWR